MFENDDREVKKHQLLLSSLSFQCSKFNKVATKGIVDDEHIDFVVQNGNSQNLDYDFQNSRRIY